MAAVEVVLTEGEEKDICQFNQFPFHLIALQPNEETGMLFLRWRGLDLNDGSLPFHRQTNG